MDGLKISVVGLGGAGSNAVNRLMLNGITTAQTIAANTDASHLRITRAHKKILLGKSLTRGLGAGGNPAVGRKAAELSKKELYDAIDGSSLVFLTAGLGGGTGSGSIPVVAEIARDIGAVSVAIVTFPFSIERTRIKKAKESLYELIEKVDTVILIDNNKLVEYAPKLPLDKAFELVDSITARAVKGISDLIKEPSLMNIDFADIRAVLKNGGLASISLGEGKGYNKVDDAVSSTLEHPLLDVDFEGAKGAIVHIEGNNSMTLGEAIELGNKLTESFDENASVKIGARINDDVEGLRVTAVIAGLKSPKLYNPFSREREEILFSI